MTSTSPIDSSWRNTIQSELEQFMLERGMDVQYEMVKLPTPFHMFFMHGQLACSKDLTSKAIRSFEECLRLDPASLQPHVALGRVYFAQGKYSKAEKHLTIVAQRQWPDFKTRLMLFYILRKHEKGGNLAASLAGSLVGDVVGYATSVGFDPNHARDLCSFGSDSKRWESVDFSRAKIEFRERKFTVLRNLLPEHFMTFLKSRHAHMVSSGRMAHQSELYRYATNDEPVAVLVNYQLADIISRISGKDVIPTYTCSLHYLAGGFIGPHRDRPQNEISMSFNLGIEPASMVWPLYAGEESDPVAVTMEPNDALLYRGAEVTHFRRPLPQGYTSNQIIFGFRTADKLHCYCI